MTEREEAPAATGTSNLNNDERNVNPHGTQGARTDEGFLTAGDAGASNQGAPLECFWATSPARLTPDRLSSPVQWGVYLRSLHPDADVSFSPGQVVAIGRSLGFNGSELVDLLTAFRRPTETASPATDSGEATACPTPVRKWGISRRTGFRKAWWSECGRWSCPTCGRKKAAKYVAELENDFDHTNGAWVGEYLHSEEVTTRIRQRRARVRRAVGLVLSRHVRIGDLGMEISSTALAGSSPPTTGTWMTPEGLAEHLKERFASGRSGGVRVAARIGWPEDEPCVAGSRPRSSDFTMLGTASAELEARVEEQVRDDAHASFGIDPLDDHWSDKVPVDWLVEQFGQVFDQFDAERRGETGWD